jgi:hypothetical protein
MIPTKTKGKNADASFAEVSERDGMGFLRSTRDTQRVSRHGGAGHAFEATTPQTLVLRELLQQVCDLVTGRKD